MRRRVRVVNRQDVPAVVINITQCLQLLLRVGKVTDAGLVIHIFERINPLHLVVLSSQKPARFLRRIGTRQRNQLLQLFPCKLHGYPLFSAALGTGVNDFAVDNGIVDLSCQDFAGRNGKDVLREDDTVGL